MPQNISSSMHNPAFAVNDASADCKLAIRFPLLRFSFLRQQPKHKARRTFLVLWALYKLKALT